MQQHDYVAAVLGAQLLGGQVALHNPSYTASELAHQFRLVRTSAILCSAKAFSKCNEAAKAAVSEGEQGLGPLKSTDPPKIWVFDEPGTPDESHSHTAAAAQKSTLDTVSWFHLILSKDSGSSMRREDLWQDHQSAVSPDDDAVYCFSSGTSGKSNAVCLLHRNLVANVIQATGLMRDRTMPPLFENWVSGPGSSSWYNEPFKRHPEISIDEERNQEQKAQSFLDKIRDTLNPDAQALPPVHPNERELHIDLLPQFHCYGLVVALVALHTATPRFVLPRFSLLLFLELVTKHKATFAFVVPPVLLALSRSPEVDDEKRGFDISSLTRLASGAAPLPPGLRRELWEKRKIRVTDGYGMSEMSPIICLQMARDLDIKAADGTVGQLSASTLARVVDEDGHDVPTGRKGELLLRGPQRMSGYLCNDAANKEAFVRADCCPDALSAESPDADIWLKTGDVVSINVEGFVKIHDRTKDVIKVNGFQVSPAELEDELLKSPLVHDVAVVGLKPPPDQQGEECLEEVPWAFCVASSQAKDEVSDDAARAERVVRDLNKSGRVAKYKLIRGVTWLDALPKSEAGKVLKKNLKKWKPLPQACS